jgi:hypothetical protein
MSGEATTFRFVRSGPPGCHNDRSENLYRPCGRACTNAETARPVEALSAVHRLPATAAAAAAQDKHGNVSGAFHQEVPGAPFSSCATSCCHDPNPGGTGQDRPDGQDGRCANAGRSCSSAHFVCSSARGCRGRPVSAWLGCDPAGPHRPQTPSDVGAVAAGSGKSVTAMTARESRLTA